jgi:hypothetical protein
MKDPDEVREEARRRQEAELARLALAPKPYSATGSLKAEQYERAIAYALIDIAAKLDKIAGHLGKLIEIQSRIADSEASPPPRYDLK